MFLPITTTISRHLFRKMAQNILNRRCSAGDERGLSIVVHRHHHQSNLLLSSLFCFTAAQLASDPWRHSFSIPSQLNCLHYRNLSVVVKLTPEETTWRSHRHVHFPACRQRWRITGGNCALFTSSPEIYNRNEWIGTRMMIRILMIELKPVRNVWESMTTLDMWGD